MATRVATDFAALLAPTTIADFLATHWERGPFHASGDPHRFDGLIGLGDIERLIAAAPDRPGQRGVFAVRSDDTSVEYPLRGSSPGIHQPAAVYQAIASGYTIVINQVSQIDRGVSLLCADAADHLQHPVGCNLYLTPQHARGFEPHRDFQDTFFVQLAGAKHWSVWEPEPDGELALRLEPIAPIEAPTGPPTAEFDLTAGDVLYMPRGWIHSGTTTDDLSLHITLGAKVTTWFDVVSEQLRTAALADVRFRTAVPLQTTAANRRSCELARVPDELLAVVGSHEAELALSSLLARLVSGQQPPMASRVGGIFCRDEVDAATVVARAKGLAPVVETSARGCRIAFAGSSVTGPPEAVDAFDFVVRHRQFVVGDLPGLPEDAQLDLARELIVQGCVQVVDDRRCAGEPTC